MEKGWMKLRHIIKGWYYRMKGVNVALMAERLEKCKKCEEKTALTKNVSVCSICWCELKAKASLEEERCPNGLW